MISVTDEIWVLTDGRPGHVSQTLGLAEALTPAPVLKRIRLRSPYRQASPFLGWAGGRALADDSAPVAPPWPRLIITSGRSAIPIALAIKHATGGLTRIVNVQDPGYFRSRFDLIVVPEHDQLSGRNIVSTAGALGRITQARLAAAAAEFADTFGRRPSPRVAVLIGGANAIYRTPPAVAERLAADLRSVARQGASLLVTFSRRTGPELERAIRSALADSDAYIWDGTGPNPYFAMLALADHVLATEDSASMISEAGTAGRPVSLLRLEGGSAKFRRFHDSMRARGVTRPFDGSLAGWSFPPFDETTRIAAMVREMMAGDRVPL